MTRSPAIAVSLLLAVALVFPASAQRKKKKGDEELPTQALEVLPEPPAFTTVESSRLGYLVSPLSSKGLLSQQTRDALKALIKMAHGASIVRVRAFVAGTGDMRRVQTIVAEEFASKRQPLPVVSVVQVGQLPLEGAQVLIEATTAERKAANLHGVALLAGQPVTKKEPSDNPLEPVGPLVAESLNRLDLAAKGANVPPGGMLRVTCLLSSLADYAAISQSVAGRYPGAAIALIQLQRAPSRPVVECEGAGRLATAPAARTVFLNPDGLAKPASYSQAVQLNGRLVLTGSQLIFGDSEKDVRLGFDRLKRVLEQAQASYRDVVWTSFYPLTAGSSAQVAKLRFEYLSRDQPPAGTFILFEGLPSIDARCGVELIAAVP